MEIFLLIFLSFLFSFILIPLIIKYSIKWNLTDTPNNRKLHIIPIPAHGGLPIFFSIILCVIIFDIYLFKELLWVFIGLIIIVFTGTKDDIHPLPPSIKFLSQFLGAFCLVVIGNFHFQTLFGILGIYSIPDIISMPISILFVVILINSINLIDGVNGLAASICALFALTYGILFFYQKDETLIIAFSIVGSVLAFLYYNMIKKSIFLGDSGSMLLGYVLSFFIFKFLNNYQQNPTNTPFITTPIGFALTIVIFPILDVVRLFFFRIFILKKSPFHADKYHLHHLLLKLNFSHNQITGSIFLICLFIIITAFFIQSYGNLELIIAMTLIGFLLVIILDFVIAKKYFGKSQKKSFFNFLHFENSTINQFQLFILLALASLVFSFPFSPTSTTIFYIILIICLLVNIYGSYKFFQKPNLTYFILVPILFFSFLSYFINPPSTFSKLSLKFAYIIFPFAFYSLNIDRLSRYIIYVFFILGCIFCSVFIDLNALSLFFKNYDFQDLMGENLIKILNFKAIYLSYFFSFAFVLLIKFIIQETRIVHKFFKYLFYLIITLNIYLLNDIIGIIWVNIFALGIFVFSIFFRPYLVRKSIYLMAIPLLLNMIFYSQLSFDYYHDIPLDEIQSHYTSLIKNNLWFGNGELYQTLNINNSKWNTHNQFIEFIVQYGIVGLSIIILSIIGLIYISITSKSWTMLIFIILTLFFWNVESFLQSQAGTYFFCFFISLFLAEIYYERKQLKTILE